MCIHIGNALLNLWNECSLELWMSLMAKTAVFLSWHDLIAMNNISLCKNLKNPLYLCCIDLLICFMHVQTGDKWRYSHIWCFNDEHCLTCRFKVSHSWDLVTVKAIAHDHIIFLLIEQFSEPLYPGWHQHILIWLIILLSPVCFCCMKNINVLSC